MHCVFKSSKIWYDNTDYVCCWQPLTIFRSRFFVFKLSFVRKGTFKLKGFLISLFLFLNWLVLLKRKQQEMFFTKDF